MSNFVVETPIGKRRMAIRKVEVELPNSRTVETRFRVRVTGLKFDLEGLTERQAYNRALDRLKQ